MSFTIGASPKSSGPQSYALEQAALRKFKVAHQHVQLDVDMVAHKINGTVDIILIPLVQNLDYIVLDCNDMVIKDVIIEDRRCEKYIHNNPASSLTKNFLDSKRDILYTYNSIEQAHFLRGKFADLNERPEDDSTKAQLIIKVPPTIKITLHDANTLASYTPITPSFRGTPTSQDLVFTPISVKIEYEVVEPATGVRFDTFFEDKRHLWNAFTANSELCCSAAYWMPCVNALDEKCTWELDISVPRRVKDIGQPRLIGQETKTDDDREMSDVSSSRQVGDDEEDEDYDVPEEEDIDNPLERDILVCCSEFSTVKEMAHPTDLSKKVFSFRIFNPVAPHHIGWAVGAFNMWSLPTLDGDAEKNDNEKEDNEEGGKSYNSSDGENDEGDTMDDYITNDVIPIRVYTLPTPDVDERTVMNSTLVCQNIMDLYSKEFGSYPFTSYSLVFLPTVTDRTMDFAGLTVCNTRLLYPPTVIEPMVSTTNALAWALATQWSGVNITPLDFNDIWCCVGMAGFMVFQAIRKLFGNNEYRYRLKLYSEAIVEQDWEKPPMGSTFTGSSRPVCNNSKEIEFIRLKAPMVIHILHRRMTKTERSFGMSRVLPKIFLQAMSGDLRNNSLSAAHFQHVCERVNKGKLEDFFQQWVYGSGVPVFRVTQRFNKKRMVIEVGIRQCQAEELGEGKVYGSDGFFSSALTHFEHPDINRVPCFTGSMTIRIHETDGTPYEHIVDIKDIFTKIDIQYNTKYKKLKGRRLPSKSDQQNDSQAGRNVDGDGDEDAKLGRILTTPQDCQYWDLTPVSRITNGNESQMQNEVFEWIRIDSDFEWISKLILNQPDYMFASQLRQDIDVCAQFESIRYFEDVVANSVNNSLVYSSILTRTVLDERYFYGIRKEACKALGRFIYRASDGFTGGLYHLLSIFRHYFCFPNSNIPKNNDFSDFQRYVIRKTIPKCLSLVRDEHNEIPKVIKDFLFDILTYNENEGNFYDDSYYITTLIDCVVECCIFDREDTSYLMKVKSQLERFENLGEWLPSYEFVVSRAIFEAKFRLAEEKLLDFNDTELSRLFNCCLEMSGFPENTVKMREGITDLLLLVFKILLCQGGIKNQDCLKLFFELLCFYPDIYVRERLINVFIESIDFTVKETAIDTLDDDIAYLRKRICPEDLSLDNLEDNIATLVIRNFGSEIYTRKDHNLRSNIEGLSSLLKEKFKDYKPLKELLWKVLHSPILTLYQRKCLFDISTVLYDLENVLQVKLITPRIKKLVARKVNASTVVIKRGGMLKVHLKVEKKPDSATEVNVANAITAPPGKKKKSKEKTEAVKKEPKGTVNKIGYLPLRFVRIRSGNKRVDVSSAPFSGKVKIIKANTRQFLVQLTYHTKEPEN